MSDQKNQLKMLELFNANEGSRLTIKAAENEQKNPTFEMIAYTGGKMLVRGFPKPVVVDLNGLETKSRRPIFFAHEIYLDSLIGQTETITKDGGQLKATGVVLGESEIVQKMIALSKKGFLFGASIAADIEEYRQISDEEREIINGQEIEGPAIIVTKSKLREISFVLQGADDDTIARIAAKKPNNDIIAEKKIMNEKENQTINEAKMVEKVNQEVVAKSIEKTTIESMRDEIASEVKRIAAIRKECGGEHPDIEAQAIKEGWNLDKVKLEVLRAERKSPMINKTQEPAEAMLVLEAAAMMSAGIPGDELLKTHGEKVVEAADREYKGKIGLQQLVLEAARVNGYSGKSGFTTNPTEVFQAAFPKIRAGFSTLDLPGIMSNVANKFLIRGFNQEESTWREISRIRSVSDFKTITSYRMTSGFEFDEIGPTGELKHGSVGEEVFTNRARTHGKMFAITREDLYNDDLGALQDFPMKIGQGGHRKLNKVFWQTFMNNADFFTDPRGNYQSGVTSALSIGGLSLAELMFLSQTDADGAPIGAEPKFLLVPPALSFTARQLMASVRLGTGTSAGEPEANPYAGMFTVLVARYLSNPAMPGYSNEAWYLLADPNDIATIEVCFLNGKEMPTIESADTDFNILGVQFRGYFDFGCSLQDYRGGVKMTGVV